MSPSENGFQKPLEIDVTNEHAFKTGVVQTLQLIADRTECIPSMKKKVDKHEQIVQTGKWLGVPLLILFHSGLKYVLQKLGW
jgi:hypothetical protein